MADFDFENPAYEDEQAPLLDDTFIEDPESVGVELPSIPGESANTLRNK